MLALDVLTQLDGQHEHLAALRTLVALVDPVVAQFVDALRAVRVEEAAADVARVDARARVHGVDVRAQVELGRHEDPAEAALPLLSTCAKSETKMESALANSNNSRFHRNNL